MSYFSSLDIGASALTAQSLRIDTISQNIANAQTTRSENGQPYKRKFVLFEERKADGILDGRVGDISNSAISGNGVRVTKVMEDNSPFKRKYEPGHPDADEDGYVNYPNVETIVEMVNLISATKAYEASVTGMNSSKSLALKALEIGK
jgi:flagellar basal-body rod protein FlgC